MRWLKRLLLGPDIDEGFGQSLADDLRFLHRFRACRRRAIAWHLPDEAERAAIDVHPVLGRFGDWTVAVAEVDGRCWIVRDRDWSGWPDPPAFVFFAVEGNVIWSAADFHRWPRGWVRPTRTG